MSEEPCQTCIFKGLYIVDTMIAAYVLGENSPNGLKYLSRTILGAPDLDYCNEEYYYPSSKEDKN